MNSRFWKEFARRLANPAYELLWTFFPLIASTLDKSRARYWRTLPIRRMTRVIIGQFFTLAGLGFFLDLVGWMGLEKWAVLVFSALIGLSAVAFFTALNRRWLRSVPVLAVLVTATAYSGRWLPRAGGASLPAAARQRIIFDAAGMLAAMILGYRFFLQFMSTEGVEQTRVRTELDLAHGIQQTLAPPVSCNSEAFEVYGATIPCEEVGGDLVDAIPAQGGMLACLADISGHGIPAGVLMANVKTTLRLGCDQGQPLPALLEAANRVLPAVKQPEMYATMSCLLLTGDGKVEYSTAGHLPLLHFRKATGEIRRCSMSQFPVGLLPVAHYESVRIACEPGDLLVVVSDGIAEATDPDGVEFGLDGVEQAIRPCIEMPLVEIARMLFTKLKTAGHQADDQSILLIRARRNR